MHLITEGLGGGIGLVVTGGLTPGATVTLVGSPITGGLGSELLMVTGGLAGQSIPAPTLTVSPATATLLPGQSLSLVATLRNSNSPLYVSCTGGGSLSTTSALSGQPVTYTAPSAGSGPFAVLFSDLNDNLSAACSGTYGAPQFDDLLDAAVALVRGLMVGTVSAPGALTWFGTGPAPDGMALPLASVGEPDEDDDYWTTQGDSTADGHFEVTCFAPTKKAARALGDRVSACLQCAAMVQVGAEVTDPAWLAVLDSIPPGALAFAAGTLVYLRQSGRSAALDPDPAPGGGDCWAEVRQFHFIYAT